MSTNTPMTPKARVIAFYLPQFHPIPENDLWWEPGFTEWTNVGKAKPLFPGHYQPKLPTELGYYDLRVPETRKAQAELARQYGVEGFCYWHYWFGNGKKLLERPLEEVSASGEPDFPFCVAWANESWRGFHHGLKRKDTLIDQLYPGEEDDIAHFNYLLPLFKDPRYITVHSKPLFLIYQPNDNPAAIESKIKLWRRLAAEAGLPGIHFVAITYKINTDKDKLMQMGFDAININRMLEMRKHLSFADHRLSDFRKILRWPKMVPYNKLYPYLIGEEEKDANIYPTIIPNWDHTPRTGRKGLILTGTDPNHFAKHVRQCVNTIRHKAPEDQLLFLKSWNEWAEGNYMEPDRKYGRGFLEALQSELQPTK